MERRQRRDANEGGVKQAGFTVVSPAKRGQAAMEIHEDCWTAPGAANAAPAPVPVPAFLMLSLCVVVWILSCRWAGCGPPWPTTTSAAPCSRRPVTCTRRGCAPWSRCTTSASSTTPTRRWGQPHVGLLRPVHVSCRTLLFPVHVNDGKAPQSGRSLGVPCGLPEGPAVCLGCAKIAVSRDLRQVSAARGRAQRTALQHQGHATHVRHRRHRRHRRCVCCWLPGGVRAVCAGDCK